MSTGALHFHFGSFTPASEKIIQQTRKPLGFATQTDKVPPILSVSYLAKETPATEQCVSPETLRWCLKTMEKLSRWLQPVSCRLNHHLLALQQHSQDFPPVCVGNLGIAGYTCSLNEDNLQVQTHWKEKNKFSDLKNAFLSR